MMTPRHENPSGNTESVAVCIPTWNQGNYLAGAVESILAQDYAITEIIVADDASTDDTPQICARFACEIPFFRVYRHPRNLGIQDNTDFLLRQATSTWVVRLDSDDHLLPNYVRRMVGALQAQPDAAYAHGDAWEIDARGKRRRLRTLYRAPGYQTARDALIGSIHGYRVAANILTFRRSALEKVDFTRGRGDFAEDYHLAVALARAGYGNIYLSEPLAEYRVWQDPRGVRARRKEQELRGLIRVFDQQIEPGFREAGLTVAPLKRARQTSALRHVVVLDAPNYSAAEKKRLETCLFELGDSWTLRMVMRLIVYRLGFLWRAGQFLLDSFRALAKTTLLSLAPGRS